MSEPHRDSIAEGLEGMADVMLIAGFKSAFSFITSGVGIMVSMIGTAGKAIGAALLNPWVALAAAIALATTAVLAYYKAQERKQKEQSKQLEQERQRVVAESFRDAGQAVPSDLSKVSGVGTSEFRNVGFFEMISDLLDGKGFVGQKAVGATSSRVNRIDSSNGALSQFDRDLADEVEGIKSALEAYRERIEGAKRLLDRGTITRDQYAKFATKELANFKKNDPTTQARESLAKQLMTPMEIFRASVAKAQTLFANNPVMLQRAVAAAEAQFRANDKATQLAKQLETPLEQYKRATAEAHKVFADDPENLRRALASAADQFRAIDPVTQFAQQLQTPLEAFNARMAEISKTLGGSPELLARARKQAVEQFNQDDPDRSAAKAILDSLKTGGETIAEKLAEAYDLVGKGLLDKSDVAALRTKLFERELGKRPEQQGSFVESQQVSSSAVAGRIGNFAPVASSAEQKNLEYQREQRDLIKETNGHLAKMSRNRGGRKFGK